MAEKQDKRLIKKIINNYLKVLKKNNIPLWRVYLYGSWVKDTAHKDSDIDLAIFWDKENIDGFEEDALLLKLTKYVDLRIEPHSFSKQDFKDKDPFIQEIIDKGERIL